MLKCHNSQWNAVVNCPSHAAHATVKQMLLQLPSVPLLNAKPRWIPPCGWNWIVSQHPVLCMGLSFHLRSMKQSFSLFNYVTWQLGYSRLQRVCGQYPNTAHQHEIFWTQYWSIYSGGGGPWTYCYSSGGLHCGKGPPWLYCLWGPRFLVNEIRISLYLTRGLICKFEVYQTWLHLVGTRSQQRFHLSNHCNLC